MKAGSGEIGDDVLAALGKMTVAFASLDSSINLWVAFYLYSDSIDYIAAYTVIPRISFRAKVERLAALYRLRLGEAGEEDKLKSAVIRITKVEEHRNRLTHGYWDGGTTERKKVLLYRHRVGGKRGYDVEHWEYSAKDLEDFVSEIKAVETELSDLILDGLSVWRKSSEEIG